MTIKVRMQEITIRRIFVLLSTAGNSVSYFLADACILQVSWNLVVIGVLNPAVTGSNLGVGSSNQKTTLEYSTL